MTAGKDDRAMGWLGGPDGPFGAETADASAEGIPALPIGTILAGKYRIDRVLGRGGMGVVVRAMHLQLHQPVAMKFLLRVQNAKAVQRFMREAQASVRLRSEHVARVFDVGTLEMGTPYIVLEYLEGADLGSLPRAPLGVGGLIDLILQACEALAEAHALGIVHRDIKPANLFVTRGLGGAPILKLLDFGVSKATQASKLTSIQTALGTPVYMSPEQIRSSRDVDHRSDIWSLGTVLYELLEGMRPFEGDTLPAIVLKVAHDPLPPLTADLPPGLDAVVYRCLEKDRARRFQSVADLAAALAPYAQSPAQAAITLQRTRSVGTPERTPAPAADPGAAPLTIELVDSASPALVTYSPPVTGVSRSRRWVVAAGLGTLIGTGLALLMFARGGSRDPGDGVAPGIAPPPITAVPPAAERPGVGSDRVVLAAPPAIDGGTPDTFSAVPSNDTAVPPSRPTPDDKPRRQGTTERAHATTTKRSTPLNTDRGD